MTTENSNSGAVGFPVGTKIGKYEIVARLGIGGQAIVYKAYEPLLDRYVAIKQISSHLAENADFMERFRKEAQILARLATSQPALVTIHELIQEERGLFIVMEFVPGHTLETTLSENPGPVQPKAVLQILWRLAGGLHAVHSAGIIHRDIKPGNIMIGDGLKVKITDFGVAASAGGQTSMVLGTTKYMAPELYGGKNVDTRADMYSLGFIAYEMLLGRAKFNEIFSEVVRDKHSEALRWMKWHGNDQVTAPPLNEIDPTIPKSLSDIVATMMAKDPAQRFETMEQLGRAIKTSFSPRAQAGREGAGAAARASAAAVAPGAAEEAPSGLEVGEELMLLPDAGAPATAPIPKRQMTLKSKLILAGVAAFIVVGSLVYLLVSHQMTIGQRNRDAAMAFNDAEKAYRDAIDKDATVKVEEKEGLYKDAIARFDKVVKEYPGTDQESKSTVLVCMSKARQAVDDASAAKGKDARQKLWTLAEADGKSAKTALQDVQRKKGDMGGWAGILDREIEEFDEGRVSSATFWGAMDTAEAALKELKFDEARDIKHNLERVRLTAQQATLLQAFYDKVDLTQFETRFAECLKLGEEAIKSRTMEAAGTQLTQARTLLQDTHLKLSDKARREHEDTLNKLWQEFKKLGNYGDLMQRADQAIQENNKAEAVKLMLEAIQIQPSPALKDKITSLRFEMTMEEAKALQDQKDLAGAREKFVEADKIKPSEDAKREIAKIDKGLKLHDLISDAEKARNNGDMKEAAKKYQEAVDLEPNDPDIRSALKECVYAVKFSDAQGLARKKDYKAAEALLDECSKLMPDKELEINQVRDEMKQTADYDQHVANGKQLVLKKQWDNAVGEFQIAQKIKDIGEVRDLIKQTKCKQTMESGQQMLDANDLKGALAQFKLAQSQYDSEEVRKKIKETEDRIAKADKK